MSHMNLYIWFEMRPYDESYGQFMVVAPGKGAAMVTARKHILHFFDEDFEGSVDFPDLIAMLRKEQIPEWEVMVTGGDHTQGRIERNVTNRLY